KQTGRAGKYRTGGGTNSADVHTDCRPAFKDPEFLTASNIAIGRNQTISAGLFKIPLNSLPAGRIMVVSVGFATGKQMKWNSNHRGRALPGGSTPGSARGQEWRHGSFREARRPQGTGHGREAQGLGHHPIHEFSDPPFRSPWCQR